VKQNLRDLIDRESGWSNLQPGNIHGGGLYLPPGFFAPNANSGGQDTAGTLATPPGGTTTALGTVGTVWDGATYSAAPADFSKIVTALVIRNTMEVLRDKAVVLQAGQFIHATHVPGTNVLRYTAFADLGPAENLLEGVPPQPEGLTWDVQEFFGVQKGKLVAITDLAEEFSPFEFYRIAAEKIAWNAVDTAEKDAVALVNALASPQGVTIAGIVAGQPADNVVQVTVGLKKADVPTFQDGTYHALISPADAAKVMLQTGEKGWTDTMKYANGTALLNGEIGQFRGIRFEESNRIADGKTVIFGPDAFIWGDYQTIQAYRVAPGNDHSDPLAQRGLVGWKGMWGTKLNQFSGAVPRMGPAGNLTAARWTQQNIT
jgi:N4-gp56 family major capsid protein